MSGVKLKFTCNECGSDDVQAEMYCEWNIEQQRWEPDFINDFSQCWCQRCQDGTRISQVSA